MDDQQRYVACLLDAYRRLPGTLGHVLSDDRRTARRLYDRHVDLDTVRQAFLLACARRSVAQRPPPIRTLRYFVPLVEELIAAPLDPGYLRYLEARLAGAHRSI